MDGTHTLEQAKRAEPGVRGFTLYSRARVRAAAHGFAYRAIRHTFESHPYVKY